MRENIKTAVLRHHQTSGMRCFLYFQTLAEARKNANPVKSKIESKEEKAAKVEKKATAATAQTTDINDIIGGSEEQKAEEPKKKREKAPRTRKAAAKKQEEPEVPDSDLIIEITDNGVGFSKEILQALDLNAPAPLHPGKGSNLGMRDRFRMRSRNGGARGSAGAAGGGRYGTDEHRCNRRLQKPRSPYIPSSRPSALPLPSAFPWRLRR